MTALFSTPEELDWYVYANSLNEETVFFRTATGEWDLTGATVYAVAKQDRHTDIVVATAIIYVVDAVGGETRVRWPGTEVAAVLDGIDVYQGVWDMKVLEQGAAEAVPVLGGRWIASMDVSR